MLINALQNVGAYLHGVIYDGFGGLATNVIDGVGNLIMKMAGQ